MGNLIKKKARNIHRQDIFYNSELEELINAITNDNIEEIRKIRKKGKVNFTHYTQTGDNPLHIAVKMSSRKSIEYLLENIPEINIEDKNFNGDTALMIAIFRNNLSLIKNLINNHAANVNTREKGGSTPIIIAAANGFLPILQYLVFETKADCTIRNNDFQTAVHRAAFYGELKILDFLRQHTPLSFCCKDRLGNTPLHLASMRLKISCIRYILAK